MFTKKYFWKFLFSEVSNDLNRSRRGNRARCVSIPSKRPYINIWALRILGLRVDRSSCPARRLDAHLRIVAHASFGATGHQGIRHSMFNHQSVIRAVPRRPTQRVSSRPLVIERAQVRWLRHARFAGAVLTRWGGTEVVPKAATECHFVPLAVTSERYIR
jgi:hypothetical protein